MARKNMTVDQFIKFAKRIYPDIKLTIKNFEFLENGEFLGIFKTKREKWYRIHLQKIFIKKYSLLYRTTRTKDKKAREGKELLISNMPLPKGPVIL